ncbi:unnamed protein product, partial [Arabidopsis halleri]
MCSSIFFSKKFNSIYRGKNRDSLFSPLYIEKKIEISILEVRIEVGWSKF